MLGDLVVNLVARVNQFTGPMRAARGVLGTFQSATTSAVSGVMGTFGRLASVRGIVSSALGGLSVGAAIKSFADAGSALNDMSARTGASVESLSLLQFAAKQTGTDMGTVESGIKKLDNAMSDAVGGNKAAAKSFTDIGLDAATLIDMPLDERLQAIAAAFDKISNPSKRGAAAVDLLGKSGRELIPMLKELQPLQERGKELGLGWTSEDAALADAVGDRMDEVTSIFGRLTQIVGSQLGPSFLMLTDGIAAWIPAVSEFGASAISMAGDLYQTLVFVFANFGELASLTLSQVGLYFVTLGNDIAHFFISTLPAALMGFVTYATSLMSTLLDNISGKMADVKALVTGGSATHEWKSLGNVEFQMTAPQRQQTDLEKGLQQSIEGKKERLGEAWNAQQTWAAGAAKPAAAKRAGPLFEDEESLAKANAAAEAANAKTETKRNKVNSDWQEQIDKANKKSRLENEKEMAGDMKPAKSAGAIGVRTQEAYQSIVGAMSRGNGDPQKAQHATLKTMAKAQEESNRHLKEIVKKEADEVVIEI